MNLNSLARDLSQHLLNREYYETRHGYEEDDALIGLFNMVAAVYKHNPPYKNTDECRVRLIPVTNVQIKSAVSLDIYD